LGDSNFALKVTRKKRGTREIAKPEKKNEQIDMFKKQVAKLQKQLTHGAAVLTKRVSKLT